VKINMIKSEKMYLSEFKGKIFVFLLRDLKVKVNRFESEIWKSL